MSYVHGLVKYPLTIWNRTRKSIVLETLSLGFLEGGIRERKSADEKMCPEL